MTAAAAVMSQQETCGGAAQQIRSLQARHNRSRAEAADGNTSGAQLRAEELDRLVAQHLPQVRYIARHIHDRLPRHVALDDLVHAGILGLIDALHKFDPARHVQLSSYAKFRIRGAILDSLRELDWSPRGLRRKARQLDLAEARIRARLGRAPSQSELAEQMGMSLAALQDLLADLRGLDLTSLQDTSAADGGESSSYAVEVPDPGPDPFQLYCQGELRDLLAAAIGQLPERERQVLALYYYEELNLKEIGEVLGVGQSRVSQIHTAAMNRLRARLVQQLGEPGDKLPWHVGGWNSQPRSSSQPPWPI